MKIISPLDGKSYSIFDKTGKQLLKNYIRAYKKGGGMTAEEGA